MHLATEIIGWIAAVLSMIFLVPQVWKTFRTRSAIDISMWGNLVTAASGVTWMIYGVCYNISNWQLVATNSLMTLCAIVFLIYQRIWIRTHRDIFDEAQLKARAAKMSTKKLTAAIAALEAEEK